jgi:hypothetical protein
MRKSSIFDYFVPHNDAFSDTLQEWKETFDACRSDWEKISEGVVSTYGADGYKLKSFLVPRFRFDRERPNGWKRHPDGLFSPPPHVAKIAFDGLPTPNNFTKVCEGLGFPKISHTDLQYWLIWTPNGRLIVSAPNEELMQSRGVTLNAAHEQFFADHFDRVSEARYKYWIAREFLELNGETPD